MGIHHSKLNKKIYLGKRRHTLACLLERPGKMSKAEEQDAMRRRDSFRQRFRRSGSLGIPFVPDNEIADIKEYWTVETDSWYHEQVMTIVLPLPHAVDGLTKALKLLQDKGLFISHIESRQSHSANYEMDVLIQIKLTSDLPPDFVSRYLQRYGYEVADCRLVTPKTEITPEKDVLDASAKQTDSDGAPWFPRTIQDLDHCAKKVLMYGSELDADHPGFKDEVYRKRRMYFAELALNYKHGDPIPRVDHTEAETKTWSTIYRELRRLHIKHACKEFLENFKLLEACCGYGENAIPQLDDVSRFLKTKTGFQIRPVAGYLSSRDFLNCLAFRVFNCTQYIRHPSDPLYSPEPDCCHELLGHVPLFADPDFAQFSQEIGLASLGASDDDVKKLATLYFFTVEFGLCRQEGELKIYGAGLLSSIGELKHAVEDNPEILPFDPDRVVQQECLITTFQQAYFYTENFEEAQQKIRMFTQNMRRPFVVRYNPYTESMEVLNNKRSLTLAVNSLRSDFNLMASALHKLL